LASGADGSLKGSSPVFLNPSGRKQGSVQAEAGFAVLGREVKEAEFSPLVVTEVVEKDLDWGNLRRGFARIRVARNRRRLY
jgi:hypothetical protein